MMQFAHNRYLPCCQCTETRSHVSFIQNDIKLAGCNYSSMPLAVQLNDLYSTGKTMEPNFLPLPKHQTGHVNRTILLKDCSWWTFVTHTHQDARVHTHRRARTHTPTHACPKSWDSFAYNIAKQDFSTMWEFEQHYSSFGLFVDLGVILSRASITHALISIWLPLLQHVINIY